MQLYDVTGLPVEHSGIKGMRWGQRRYQNLDGTLTPEGKKRYNKKERAKEVFNDESKYELAKKRYGNSGVKNIATLVDKRGFSLDDAIKEQEKILKFSKVSMKVASVGAGILAGKITSDIATGLISKYGPTVMAAVTSELSKPENIEKGRVLVETILTENIIN
jgi:hypothetical protein